jgi:hypothetical protein
MVHALLSINNGTMSGHPPTDPRQPTWLSSTPPRRVLGSLVAYVSAVSIGIAAVAALATAEVPLETWISPF